MPTENRSSNTDPRDVFIRLNPLGLGVAELRKDSTGFEDPRTHSDYLLFLTGYREAHPEPLQHTEQHQGEPVAWQVRSKTNRAESQWTPWKECCEMTRAMHSHEVGRFNQFGIMREIRPVFANAADHGEVDRLRADLGAANAAMFAECEKLRTQLAERDALLQESYAELLAIKAEIGFRGATIGLIGRIDAALSDTAAQEQKS